MLRLYASLGFSAVVVTPHLDADAKFRALQAFDQALMNISEMAFAAGFRVISGAEVRLTPDLSSEDIRPIEGTRYVLVDFSSGSWPFYAEDSIFRLQSLGYRPILAHPERYGWLSDGTDIARSLVHRGVVLQVTLASVTGLFGRSARRCAIDLLEAGTVHILATDAHGVGARLTAAEQAMAWLEKEYGETALDELLNLNPSRILLDQEVAPVQITGRGRNRLSRSLWQAVRRLDRWRS